MAPSHAGFDMRGENTVWLLNLTSCHHFPLMWQTHAGFSPLPPSCVTCHFSVLADKAAENEDQMWRGCAEALCDDKRWENWTHDKIISRRIIKSIPQPCSLVLQPRSVTKAMCAALSHHWVYTASQESRWIEEHIPKEATWNNRECRSSGSELNSSCLIGFPKCFLS